MLGMRGRYGNDRDADALAARYFFQVADIVDGDAAARLLADFLLERVEQRRDLESFLAEPGIIGKREPQISGAHDRDPQLAIQTENLAEVALEIADVISDAAHAE